MTRVGCARGNAATRATWRAASRSLVGVLLFVCVAAGCAGPFTDRQLSEFVAAVEPQLQLQTGRGIPPGLRVEWTSADFGDDVARYEHEERLVVISGENLVSAWELISTAGESVDDYARLVVLHELVHAVDAHTPGVRWPSQDENWDTSPMRALLSVIEGHAHLVCLRAAAAQGLETEAVAWFAKSFDTQVSVGKHWVGAAFLEAVERTHGRAGVEHALRNPPKSLAVLRDPEQYLRELRAEPVDAELE